MTLKNEAKQKFFHKGGSIENLQSIIQSRFCAFLFAFSTTSCKSGTLEKKQKTGLLSVYSEWIEV